MVQQGLSHGGGDDRPHGLLVSEPDLALGGMHIGVDFRGIDFQEETGDRVTSLHQRGVVSFHEREVQAPVFDRPPVHEQVLVLAGGA